MMNIRTLLAVITTVFAVGCGHHNDKNVVDAKLNSVPEVNEVEVIELKKKDFAHELLSNGKLRAVGRASLSFSSNGAVSELFVANGSKVKAGQVIAILDRPDMKLSVDAAQIALQKAELDLYDVLAGQGYKASDTLSVPADVLTMAKMRSGYSSALNTLKKVRLDYEGTILKAPFAGRVADLKYKKFDQVVSGPFCTIVDDSALDVDFFVMESEYLFLSKGLGVRVMPFADQTKTLVGEILHINPVVDKNGQISVRAGIRNNGELIDGMNVKVVVENSIPDCLVVPRSAVVVRDNLDVLFTYTDDGLAHWVYVDILQSNSESHVVQANSERGAELSEGDKVIVKGNLNLADRSKVQLKK